MAARGFALIATVSVMVLLVMIALAMLSLSTLELRQSTNDNGRAEAQANARMALMLAIGELQRAAGPDQRVTARADILDGAIPEKRYWTGVWSTADWESTKPNQNKKFVDWLVSRTDQTAAQDSDIEQPFTGGELITLVGDGSVVDPVQHVQAERVATGQNGGYAYWVGDQGVKASSGVAGRKLADKWSDPARLGVSERTALDATGIAELSDFDKHSPEELSKLGLSLETIDVLEDSRVARQLFHDVGPVSLSLLTDVRRGGLVRDLSTAFELPREEFNDLEEFHASPERNVTNFYATLGGEYADPMFYSDRNAPSLGYLTEVRGGPGLFRGPTWDLLRNHYRLYKKEWDNARSWSRSYASPSPASFAARGSLPLSYSHAYNGANAPNGVFSYHPGASSLYGKAYRGHYAFTNDLSRNRGGFSTGSQTRMLIDQSPRLTPIISRVAIAIGLAKFPENNGGWKLALSFDPYVTVVNPYNVPISFQSVGIFVSKFSPINLKIEYTDQNGNRQTVHKNQPFTPNTYNQGAFAFRLQPPQLGDAWMLQPGEIKVISPKPVNNLQAGAIDWYRPTGVAGQFSYNEGSGLYWNHLHLKPKDGTTVEVTVNGKNGNEATMMTASLFYAKGHDGSARDVVTHLPPYNQYGDDDLMDDPFIAKYAFVSSSGGGNTLKVEAQRSTSQIPKVTDASSQAIAVLDMRMKSGQDDAPVFAFNVRGKSFDLRDYDGADRMSPTWDVSLRPINDLSDLQMVGDPAGHGFWGDGYSASDGGSSRVVLYEVPQLPLTSLAQLQHADISVTGSGASLLLGNSFAHPGIANLEDIYGRRAKSGGFNPRHNMQSLADLAWAGNEMLWDRYYFTGINWGTANLPLNNSTQNYIEHEAAVQQLISGDPGKKPVLMNPRLVVFGLGSAVPMTEARMQDYRQIARYLMINGGFNVNSTSEKAWRAVFATLRKADIYYNSNGNLRTKEARNAFSRFTLPVDKDNDKWSGGFMDLTDQQIADLAEAMVEQVKERGPFMGMADFVNRRLDSGKGDNGTDVGVLGALQAAIEQAGLNDRSSISNPVTKTNIEHRSYSVGGKTKRMSTYVGTPSYLMQADILSTIGNTLRARSDTFVIRAYGEARDANDNVIARAWCEATVQRSADWYKPTDEEPTQLDPNYASNSPAGDVVVRPWIANPAFPEENLKFGRKFKIVGFRWLAKDEV